MFLPVAFVVPIHPMMPIESAEWRVNPGSRNAGLSRKMTDVGERSDFEFTVMLSIPAKGGTGKCNLRP